MRKRAAPALPIALLALSGCGDATDPSVPDAEDARRIECDVGGAGGFSRACWVERVEHDGAIILVIRSDIGSFRRLTVLEDGRGVASADGADPAQVSLAGGGIEVSLAGDRYRLPATIAADRDEP